MCCGNSLLYSFAIRLKLLLDSFECLSDEILSDLIICSAENFLLHCTFFPHLTVPTVKYQGSLITCKFHDSIKIGTTVKPLTSLLCI